MAPFTLNQPMMKHFLPSLILVAALLSCKNNSPLKDLSGAYENTEDDSVTKIEKVTDTEYLIYVPDGKDKISATRNGNTLTGTFQGLNISEEFNTTCDTMTIKENGKIICRSTKVAEWSIYFELNVKYRFFNRQQYSKG